MSSSNTGNLISRRGLLQAGGLGLLNFGVPGMVAARANPGQPLGKGAAKQSCIFILLCGGPSHLDTWDLKPDAPEGIRGPYKPIATSVPGMRLSELHTKLAKQAQDFCLINSITHPGNISNHFDAMHNLLSGQHKAPADSAYFGSVLSKVRPNEQNIANYIWLIKCVGDPVFCAPNIGTGGHLGAAHSPLFVGSAKNNPSHANFKPPDVFEPAEPGRMQGRRQLLANLNRSTRLAGDNPIANDWQDLHEHAFELLTGPQGRQVFEVNREPAKIRDGYGRHPIGQNLLLARRLVESGVGFVTVNGWVGPSPDGAEGGNRPVSSSWDMHGGHMGMGNAFGSGSYGMGFCLPRLDEALSALFTDLKERGLLDTTLVVVMGEFGRSPKINTKGQPGRVHWPACYSAILAGGGVRGGQVYGASDKHASYVKDRPVKPSDLGATIYHAMKVPLETRLGKDGVSKPITTGKPLEDLF